MLQSRDECGFALVTVTLLVAVLASLLTGYFVLTQIDLAATKSSLDSTRGFYASEAGLNLRAEAVRGEFLGFDRPTGTAPRDDAGKVPCEPGNTGSGDFACLEYTIEDRTSETYVTEDASNPVSIVVPRGELFQNLSAEQYRYVVYSRGENRKGRTEAVLEMHFHSRLAPVFQFAAFYNKDLEILPGSNWALSGPVHSNGDLYLGGDNRLDVLAQVTVADDLYRGRKDSNTCMAGDPRVLDPSSLREIPDCSAGTTWIDPAGLGPWNGMIRPALGTITVPGPEILDPGPGNVYWDRADVRVVLNLQGAPAIEVRNADGSVNVPATAILNACGSAGRSSTLYNNREGAFIQMLELNVVSFLNCIDANNPLAGGKELDDDTDGGLIWYLGVDGPLSAGQNNYGVRVRNGAVLASTNMSAPPIRGLTVVTDQALYIQGDFNSTTLNWKPAAFLADSLNVLSNAWDDAKSTLPLPSRNASATTIQAAFLAGTDTTGGIEGEAGRNLGQYNGGLENYPRLHERWTGNSFTYRGSFVSLHVPRHVDGAWSASHFTAPTRDWDYDTNFDDAEFLPPLTPRLVYLEQEMFVRQFEL